ncbi:alcohol oxidase [Mycena filopes]|nr:alcohol oxidase [Mycena filopes]
MSDLEVQSFIDTNFDYIIIGGGTAGLAVANRLSEDPNVKVGILEAGLLIENDDLIDIPGKKAMNNGNPKYDWVSGTTPQSGAAGRCLPIFRSQGFVLLGKSDLTNPRRGKVLGGSSAINYMAWGRASKEEYDAWGLLSEGEGGWNWDSLLPFFKKSEDASSAGRDLATEYSLSDSHISSPGVPAEDAVGVDGPIKTRYNMCNTDVAPAYVQAWNALGQQTNLNPYGGDPEGLHNCRLSVDPKSGKRITAYSAYYNPVASRTNLKLLLGVQVTKVLFRPQLVNGNRVATGVEFTANGKAHSIYSSKEIILSAGVIQTPQILELSGIGNPKLLKKMNIETVVDLPGVGENLHDHPFTHIHYQAKPGVRTFDELGKNPEFAAAEQERYNKSGQGFMAANDTMVVFTSLNKIMDESKLSAKLNGIQTGGTDGIQSGLLQQEHRLQLDWLKEGKLAHLEFIGFSLGLIKPDPDGSYIMLSTGLQHPFSRGSVHIQSSDPLQQPLIDPRYLTEEFDAFSLLAGYRALEKLAQTPPLADLIAKQVFPASPLSDEEVIQYIRQSLGSGGHSMGTASMARRDLGGVVGNDLKVHGTANLRIVDASIVPIPLAAHVQATVYAIAEKAAHLIKSGL